MTKTVFAAIIACALLPSTARATTLTFDEWGGAIRESGYVYSNSSSYSSGGNWYFHDDSNGMVQGSIRREDGQAFNVLSMDFSGASFAYLTGSQEKLDQEGLAGLEKYNYGFVQFNGYRDGNQVASETLFGNLYSTITFSSLFSGLTSFEVKLSQSYVNLGWSYFNYPYNNSPLQPYTVYCENPGGWGLGCESVRIDNLVLRDALSAVPLPASLTALLAGLGAIGLWRRFT